MNAAEEGNIAPASTETPQEQASTFSSNEMTSPGNLEKVRDILFGAQMRDYDKRFNRLEERLVKEANEVRDETRRRFETLENYIKQEISALSERLKAENQQRIESGDEMTREMRDTAKSIGQRIGQLDEQMSQAHRDLREHILAQSRELADEIRRKHDEITAALTRESRDLRADKADRSALANLFTELAMRLNNDFKLPGDE